MPSRTFVTYTFHVAGTLAADLNIRFNLPFNAQLVHVSAVGSNAYGAGLSIGTPTDATAHMAKKAIGVNNGTLDFDFNDFYTYSNKAYPRIVAGTGLVLAVDYDYNGGGSSNASANVTIVLTLQVG